MSEPAPLAPTRAEDVVEPFIIVELVHLRTKGGDPVRVRCDKMDEMDLAKIYGLGGLNGEVLTGEQVQAALNAGGWATIIHAATALADADGNPTVRPAFYFDEEHRKPGSLPARYLRLDDRLAIISGVQAVSGLGGADEASFSSGGATRPDGA